MKLCYQVAIPDVAVADSVTAYQGPSGQSFGDLARFGYDGVELMTLNLGGLDWEGAKGTAEKYGIPIVLVCTRELSGQLELGYTSPEEEIHREAVKQTKGIIDLAGYLGANINIGRVGGQYCARLSHEQAERLAMEASRELADYAAPGNMAVAPEIVTAMQTSFINTLAEEVRMVERVGRSNFRPMIDVLHLNLEEKDLYQAIGDYSEHNIHAHLADNNRRYPDHRGLDSEEILTTFRGYGYDGNFCTEIFQIPSTKEAARGAVARLGPIVERVYGRRAADRSGIRKVSH